MAARSLRAPMSAFQPTSAGLQSAQVEVDALDDAVDRCHQRASRREAQHGGVVAQPEGLDSVFQHAPDTL